MNPKPRSWLADCSVMESPNRRIWSKGPVLDTLIPNSSGEVQGLLRRDSSTVLGQSACNLEDNKGLLSIKFRNSHALARAYLCSVAQVNL